jgi:purine-binding chemotaxis protein CheW
LHRHHVGSRNPVLDAGDPIAALAGLCARRDHLRGFVLPIVDLAGRFGFPPAEPTAQNVIIVTQIGQRTIGLLVDAVSDILTVTDDLVQATPDIASDLATTFVRGVFVIEGRMISLVALDGVVPPAERMAA